MAKNKSYPFFRDYDPGTPVNGYYARLSTVSDYLLLRVPGICFVLYLVVYGFGRYFLLVFGLYFALQIFHYEFHFTLFNHYPHLPT